MGWAKYQEDIVSRWNNDNYRRVVQRKIPSVPRNITFPAVRCVNVCSGNGLVKQEKKMAILKEFVMASARPLPVIILADISGSMVANGKIDILNEAVSEMISTFADEDDSHAEIHASIITFGGMDAKLHKELQPAGNIAWEPMTAAGRTPMGGAFALARQMIENKEIIPSRAYRPTLVLVSDGVPTDNWQDPLLELLGSERASKAMRFAMGIGADADSEPLKAFLGDEERHVFEAHEARGIKKFFQWVTMSVTTRSQSINPNMAVEIDPADLDDFEF